MLEVADALATVLKHAKPLKTEVAALTSAALGQVLAADVVADVDSPPFPKSLRDGYAVRSADCAAPGAVLKVIETVYAGKMPTKPVGAGEASRIFTGAPLPDGADAIVMQEDTQVAGPPARHDGNAGTRRRRGAFGCDHCRIHAVICDGKYSDDAAGSCLVTD